MNCRQEIEKLVKQAEDTISAGNSVGDLWSDILKAISQCPDLGGTKSQNDSALIIDDHLDKLYRHAKDETKMNSLDELMSRPVPKPTKITWRP